MGVGWGEVGWVISYIERNNEKSDRFLTGIMQAIRN